MFDNIWRGWDLFKTSLSVVREDKSLLLLPLLSGISLIIIVASFVTGMFGLFFWGPMLGLVGGTALAVEIILGFLMYFITFFVAIYFNAALVACATLRLQGKNPTISDGLQVAGTRMGKILQWSLVSATVSLILSALRSGKGVARAAGTILGIAWSVAIFFVVPVILYENLSPFKAIKRSAQLLSRSWGEALGGSLGMGIVFGLLLLGGLGIFMVGFLLFASTGSYVLFVLFLAIALIYWMIVGLVYSAVNAVLRAALYRYSTTGKVSRDFDKAFFRNPWSGAPA